MVPDTNERASVKKSTNGDTIIAKMHPIIGMENSELAQLTDLA
jgi:hypothetical protein